MQTLSTFFKLGRVYHLYYRDPVRVMRRAVLIRLILPSGEDQMVALTMYDVKGFRRMLGFSKADQKTYSDSLKEVHGTLSTGYDGYAVNDTDAKSTLFLARWQGQDRYFSVLNSKLQNAISRYSRLEKAVSSALGDVMSECAESEISLVDAIDGDMRSFRVHSDNARLGSVRHVTESRFDFMSSVDKTVTAAPFGAVQSTFELHLAEPVVEKDIVHVPEAAPAEVEIVAVAPIEAAVVTEATVTESIAVTAIEEVPVVTETESTVSVVVADIPVQEVIAVQVVEEAAPEIKKFRDDSVTASPVNVVIVPEEPSSVEPVIVGENSTVLASYKKPTDEQPATMDDHQKKEITEHIARAEKAAAEKKEVKPSFWQRLKNFFKNIFG